MNADADFMHHLLRSAELLRRGHVEAARHAVETALRSEPRARGASAALVAAVARRDEAALRAAVDEALDGVESGAAPFRLARSSAPGSVPATSGVPARRPTERPWVAREPAREVLGRVALRRQVPVGLRDLEAPDDHPPTEPSETVEAPVDPRPLAAALEAWAFAGEGPMSRGARGELVVRTDGPLLLRRGRCLALRGALDEGPSPRLARGRDTGEVLGGDAEPFVRSAGPLFGLWAAGPGAEFEALSLQDDLLYVRESALWAFEESLAYDSASLDTAGGTIDIVQLRGQGAVALRLEGRAPLAVPLDDGEEIRVAPEALLGWIGRLFPRAGDTEPPGGEPSLGFRGDGVLLLLTS